MKNRTLRGFTLIEVLVVAPIIILSVGAFIALIVTLTGNTLASRGASIMQYNIQDALDRIELDVKESAALLAVNDISLSTTNPQGYLANPEASSTGSTVNFTNIDKSGSGGSTAALVLKHIATKESLTRNESSIVYLSNAPNPCSGDYKLNTPMYTNVIYFVANDTLWRRVITPTNYATPSAYCGDQMTQRPSCGPGTTHTYCKAQDTRLLDGISAEEFNINYYNSTDSAAPNTSVKDPYSNDATRNSALAFVTTVEVSIESSQVIAGRDVTKNGTMRATRLNSTDTISKPTIPNNLQVSVFDGRKVVFTWQQAQDANMYDVEYRINGGTWQFGATLTNDYYYIVTANHTDTVEARVSARNISGTSTYATGSTSIPLWVPLPLTAGWENYAQGYSTAAYTRTRDGFVIVKGLIRSSGSPGSYSTIASLPEDYAPSGRLIFGTSAHSNVSARIDVDASGNILFGANSSATWTALDPIQYVAANSGQTRTTMTLRNGFTNYGGAYAPASWVQDSTGRVSIQGLLNAGTITMNTPISTLPVAIRPAQYQHFPSRASAFHHIALDTGTGLVARGDGTTGSYYGINISYMPSSYTDWTTMSLTGGWAAYGGIYASPQFTKTSDGLVHLKGLIRNGTSTVTTLPEGFRPSQRILSVTASADKYARIDIHPNGNITLSGASTSWVSLNGITFVAEQ